MQELREECKNVQNQYELALQKPTEEAHIREDEVKKMLADVEEVHNREEDLEKDCD